MELGELLLLLLLLLSEPVLELFIVPLDPLEPSAELLPPLEPADVPELAPVPLPAPEPELPLPPPLCAKTGAQMPRVPRAAINAVRRVNLFFECNREFMARNLAQVGSSRNGARR